MINSVLILAIGTMTSFLDSSLVIILILGFLVLTLLFFAFNILPTSSADKDRKASLTHKTLSMLDKVFIFKAYAYDFFMVKDFGAFFLTDSMFLLDGEATDELVVRGGRTTEDCIAVVGFELVEFPFKFT